MSYSLSPGGTAAAADLHAAQERQRLLAAELPRVREAATAWRNGLGGLLAALLGFGLIKGQSDVSQLAPSWAVWTGILLLAALIVGAGSALLLIRAANGSPSPARVSQLLPRSAADHLEAVNAGNALRWGIVLTLSCAALLVAAVGATWYGPGRSGSVLQVTTPTGSFCGTSSGISHGTLTVASAAGDVSVSLANVSAIRPLLQCPAPG
jgi:hypothetical protein